MADLSLIPEAAWREAKRQEPLKVPRDKELEFLPAVLEVQATPPSPAGRLVAGLIIAWVYNMVAKERTAA